MRKIATIVSVCALVVTCSAQTATLTIAHDDPDGVVSPGQVVRVSAILTSTQTVNFWEIRGSVRTSPNGGVALNNVFPYSPPVTPVTVIDPGDLSGESVLGVRMFSGDQWWLVGLTPQAPWWYNPLTALQFDWIAPNEPGEFAFNWEADAALPNAWFISPSSPLGAVAVPTSYVGASLTVVPAPGVPLSLGVATLALGTQRRRR